MLMNPKFEYYVSEAMLRAILRKFRRYHPNLKKPYRSLKDQAFGKTARLSFEEYCAFMEQIGYD